MYFIPGRDVVSSGSVENMMLLGCCGTSYWRNTVRPPPGMVRHCHVPLLTGVVMGIYLSAMGQGIKGQQSSPCSLLSWLPRGMAAVIPFPCLMMVLGQRCCLPCSSYQLGVSSSERKNQQYICVAMFLVSVSCQRSLLPGTASQTYILQVQ